MISYLSVDEVLKVHDSLIVRFGGRGGVRDDNLLESAVFRNQASFGGSDLYETIFDKAAAMFHSIIFDHPFVDGNKRSAITCASTFLITNGWDFLASLDELVAFPLAVEQTRPEILEVANWFKKHCQKRKVLK